MEILYLGGRKGEAFLLVVGVEVFDVDDGRGRVVHGEDVLIQSVVEALQHRVAAVVAGVVGHGEELLYTRNAAEVHVLGDLHGIGAPRRYHFASRAGKASCERIIFKQFGIAVKPAQLLAFFFRKHVVHLRGNDAACGCAEKQNLHKGRQKGFCKYYMCAKLRFSYEIMKFSGLANSSAARTARSGRFYAPASPGAFLLPLLFRPRALRLQPFQWFHACKLVEIAIKRLLA